MRAPCLPVLAALAILSLGAVFAAPQSPSVQQSTPTYRTPAAVAGGMDESVAAYRKIIVLMHNSAALDEGNRERVRTAAWILFEKNLNRLDDLEQDSSR